MHSSTSTRASFTMVMQAAHDGRRKQGRTMAKDFQLIHVTVDEALLTSASNRLRNQFVGCTHAHNELTILNRLLMFSMNDTGDGELHNSAQ